MLRGEGAARRRGVVVVLVLVLLGEGALALASTSGERGNTAQALPLHPVAGSFVPDDTRLTDCSDERCFQQAFGNIAFSDGPKAALGLVDEVYGDGGDPACHRVVHAIGSASLVRNRGDVARTLAEGAPTCWSGYYHGVLERSLVNVRVRTPAVMGGVARTLCRRAKAELSPWIAYQCLHGLGHGLMIATGLDLPVALGSCRRLDTDWDREACKGGVFMENLSSSYGLRSRWLRDDDPVYPCNAVGYVDKHRCYQIVTSRILTVVDGDWEKTAELCSKVERDFVSTCFQSLGRDASNRSHRTPSEVVRVCAVTRPYRGEADCVAAGAMDITANHTSGVRAAEVCQAVPAHLAGRCYYGIGTVMGTFKKKAWAREADCTSIVTELRFVRDCVRGGAATTAGIEPPG